MPYEEMTPKQRRHYDVMVFHRNLNRNKQHFELTDRELRPIVEESAKDEMSELNAVDNTNNKPSSYTVDEPSVDT